MMGARPVIGLCTCLLCEADAAEVREGEKGRPYIVCDSCVSMVKTMSRTGAVAIRARIAAVGNPAPKPAAGDPDPAPAAPAPAPKAKPKTPKWMKPWEKSEA